jgi:hypothetical protein
VRLTGETDARVSGPEFKDATGYTETDAGEFDEGSTNILAAQVVVN